MHKAKWKGPRKRIPDLRMTLDPGDEFEISEDVRLGGEGVDFDITDGPAVETLRGEAKDLGVKGALTKMTRLELDQAVTAAKNDQEAEDEKASAGDDEGDES